jgi:DNA-binding IclR family transcriptional regulator
MPATEIKPLEEGLYVVEKTRVVGRMTTVILATVPGWNRVKAWRYLETLARCGWLERIGRGRRSEYVLGRKVLQMGDISL